MDKHIRCGSLFTSTKDTADKDCTIIVGADGKINFVGPTASAPRPNSGDELVDYSGLFVMPGLVDTHTHLAYGEAKSKEDIDIYKPLEFRAIRGMFFAQKVLAAGYTSICSPGDAGQIALSIRNAIRAGLFDGPRVSAAGPYLTNSQGFQNTYPTWVGLPSSGIGFMVRNRDEAVLAIREQCKNGVDAIKLDMDGTQLRPNGEIIAAFSQTETTAMVEEVHRQGRYAVAHAYGREAVLYSARAGVDLIFHAFYLDDECVDALVKSGTAIGPTLTMPRNTIDFTEATEPAAKKGRIAREMHDLETGQQNLRKAKAAGVPFVTGTDTGFAVTPYGEWHARELELFVEYLGCTPAEAIRASTQNCARFFPQEKIGTLEVGSLADFIALDASPLENITVLQNKKHIKAIHVGGRKVTIEPREYNSRLVSDGAWNSWTNLYTQDYVKRVQGKGLPLVAAE